MSRTRLQLTLATLCFCAFAVNVDVTLVNVTLPRLVDELHASTGQLQWIVGSYSLVFAALVLTAGSLSDRFGRRRALILGLLIYGAGNAAAGLAASSSALIATRALMGVGAAVIFPTTLSIISNVFTDRRERAQAIGLWGAATGAAIALGPIAGGALLESFSWNATFLAKIPLAIAAIAMVIWVVPDSRDPEAPRLDFGGFALSTLSLGAIVFAIIEAPGAGWTSVQTVAVGTAGAVLAGLFVIWERRTPEPMLNIRLFANPRFSGASFSIAVSFFSLAAFIFLIVQYMQFLKGWSPLETGLRTLPVAIAVGVSSVLGTKVAVQRGTKVVLTAGLLAMALALTWIAAAQTIATGYWAIAGQMVLLGTGMGLNTAPATESIMGSVSLAKAGVGSALNDMTRELGSTLGVAVIGSVFASIYAADLAGRTTRALPGALGQEARHSVGAALTAAHALIAHGDHQVGLALRTLASGGFMDGLHTACYVLAAVCLLGAAVSAAVVPSQPPLPDAETDEEGRNLGLASEQLAAASAAA